MSNIKAPSVKLRLLDGEYAIARMAQDASVPGWADGQGFVSISRSDEELSVVCLAERVPADVRQDADWACLKFQGPFAFDETGIALAVIRPLAEAGIGIFLVSTFDTDYLLVKRSNLEATKANLTGAGHSVA